MQGYLKQTTASLSGDEGSIYELLFRVTKGPLRVATRGLLVVLHSPMSIDGVGIMDCSSYRSSENAFELFSV